MEEEFIQRQERFKPQEEKAQVISSSALNTPKFWPVEILLVNLLNLLLQEERTKVDDIRGTPMAVGSLEEIIDDNHAIVSSSVGPEYYVPILSFVEKDLIEPGCSVLLHNKVRGC